MSGKQAENSCLGVCLQKMQCCDAKNYLRYIPAPARLCTAATRSLTELSAFLDVSSLNLAVLRHRHFFCESGGIGPGEGGMSGGRGHSPVLFAPAVAPKVRASTGRRSWRQGFTGRATS